MNRTAPSPRWPTRRRALALITSSVATALAFPAMAARSRCGPRRADTRLQSSGMGRPRGRDGAQPRCARASSIALGFRTVRLPVDADMISGSGGTRARRSQQIHDAVETLMTAGYCVIVDMHPSGACPRLLRHRPDRAPGWLRRPGRGCRRRGGISRRRRLCRASERAADGARGMAGAARAPRCDVRERCPDHTLVWGPARYQGIWETCRHAAACRRQPIASVHYYSPMGFTHQCENWTGRRSTRLPQSAFSGDGNTPAVRRAHGKLPRHRRRGGARLPHKEFAAPWTARHIAAEFARAARLVARLRLPASSSMNSAYSTSASIR